LPAFVGRYFELENNFQDNTWQVVGKEPQSDCVMPYLTKNVDWVLKLSESGPQTSIIQKYESRPFLSEEPTTKGRKLMLRFSLFVKQFVPLQAAVS